MTRSGRAHQSLLERGWRVLSFQWTRKLGSLVLAVFVWFVATADRRTALERTLDVPVQIIDRSGGEKRVVSGIPRTVQVTLYGGRSRLEGLLPERIEADIDISGLEEGSFESAVTVRPPAETELRRVDPPRVGGLIDATVSRRFTVQPSMSDPGDASGGQNPLLRLRAIPAQVTVRGSRQQVDRVERVVTVPVSLEGTGRRESYLLALAPSGGVVTGVQFSPQRITLERLPLSGVQVRSVAVRLAPDPLWSASAVKFSSQRVRLVGPAALLAGIEALELTVPYREGAVRAQGIPRLPAGVAALEGITVTLTARRR